MIWIGAVLVVTLLSACGPSGETAAGMIVGLESETLTTARSFTLRTETGEELVFQVAGLDVSNGLRQAATGTSPRIG